MPLTKNQTFDEVQLSQVVLMAGNTSIIVVCAVGTRDETGKFVWGEKMQFQMFPEDDLPMKMDGTPDTSVRVMPKTLVKELREFLIALEDELQDIVNEEKLPLPQSMAEIKARKYKDPRVESTWKTADGHNSANLALTIPTAKSRIAAVKRTLMEVKQ